jgi:hypothetical protein
MKKVLSIIFALSLGTTVYGQKKVQVSESGESFSTGNHNALSVMVYKGNKNDVEKAWKKEMKDLKGKVSMKKEIFADDCRMKQMGDNTFDVYARVEEVKDEGVKLIMAIDLGGAYMSSGTHGDQFKIMKDLVYKFGVDQNKAIIGLELKAAEKLLSDKQGELKDLEKEKEKLHKDIEDYKKKIEQAEKDIEENGKKQEDKKVEVKEQEKVVKEVDERRKAVK